MVGCWFTKRKLFLGMVEVMIPLKVAYVQESEVCKHTHSAAYVMMSFVLKTRPV